VKGGGRGEIMSPKREHVCVCEVQLAVVIIHFSGFLDDTEMTVVQSVVSTSNGETVCVTECLTSDIFSMLLCGVSDCIIVFSIVLAP